MAGDFAISEGGELSFRNVPDFERPADSGRDNVYNFSVRASDGRNYGYLEVTVTVNDINEALAITTTSRTEFTYRENATATIYTFSAADPEQGQVTWSPGGADGDDFAITADSRGRGVLAFTNPPDYENPTDAGGDNEYQVTVQARDDAFNTASLEVTVTVTDDNEGPEISGTQSLTFSENLQEGRVLATYSAIDPEDPSAVITRWSLSGSDAGDFAINENGELSFRNVPDYERPADSGRDNVYNFSVRASDGRNYGYLEVTVTVNDINEALAITTTSRTEFTYRENGTATIYTFSAADPEQGQVTWSPGGADGDDFAITADSRGRGVLAFTNPPDFENPTDANRDNDYQVTVEATDDDGHTDTLAVTVTVTAQSEGPEIAGPQSLSFTENQATDRILAAYTAIDPEDPSAVITRWSLSGSDAGDFAISENGELSFPERAGLRTAGGLGARQRLQLLGARLRWAELRLPGGDRHRERHQRGAGDHDDEPHRVHLSGERHRHDLHLQRRRPRTGPGHLVAGGSRRGRLRHHRRQSRARCAGLHQPAGLREPHRL